MYESTGHLTKEFKYGLEQLGMLDSKESKSHGLVFTGTEPQNNYEYLALEKAEAYNAGRLF